MTEAVQKAILSSYVGRTNEEVVWRLPSYLVAMRQRSPVRAILAGGLTAGTIDIGAACLINGRSIPFVLHTIAGGLLAQRSYAGGWRTAVLGLLLQEAMSILIAAVYVSGSRYISLLTRRWVVCGLLYGAVVFVVMNYVVLPLSAWRLVPHFPAWKFAGNLLAMFLFGFIVAFFSRTTGPLGRARP